LDFRAGEEVVPPAVLAELLNFQSFSIGAEFAEEVSWRHWPPAGLTDILWKCYSVGLF
jgi:hypothetical protein